VKPKNNSFDFQPFRHYLELIMRKAPRILLLMGSSKTTQSIIYKLGQYGFDPQWKHVQTEDEFIEKLQNQQWDILIADYELRQFESNDVLDFLKNHNINVPTIFIGNSPTEKELSEAFQNGASDFIPLENLSRIFPAVFRELKYAKILKQQLLSEMELHNSNKFLLSIFDAVQEGISVLDNNLTIIRTNAWLKSQFSNKMPIVGKKCYEVYQNLTSPCSSCPAKETFKDGAVHQKCMSIQNNGSPTKWFEFVAYPLKNSRGDIVGIIQSLKDVTKRKIAEDKLIRLNKELEQRVVQRTAQLEAANKELESFSYTVSHDLRSPLARIEGYAELLLSEHFDILDEEGKHYLDRIVNSVSFMSQLIEDLLKLSRVTRSEMNFLPVNLSTIAKNITDTLIESDPKRKAEISIQKNLRTNGDRHLLHAVLDNLLGNAWKFTLKKSITKIEFGLKENQSTPVFFIRDNGAGFNMSRVKNLFTPFKRLHSDNDFPGTGIGLATVQRIIHRHGGTIWAESKENAGATFYFTLTSNGKL